MKQLLFLLPPASLLLCQNFPSSEKPAIIIIDLEQSSVVSPGVPDIAWQYSFQ